jgi:hypothetical protein
MFNTICYISDYALCVDIFIPEINTTPRLWSVQNQEDLFWGKKKCNLPVCYCPELASPRQQIVSCQSRSIKDTDQAFACREDRRRKFRGFGELGTTRLERLTMRFNWRGTKKIHLWRCHWLYRVTFLSWFHLRCRHRLVYKRRLAWWHWNDNLKGSSNSYPQNISPKD